MGWGLCRTLSQNEFLQQKEDPSPALQRRGKPLLPLHPHQPGLAAELRPYKQAAQAPTLGYPNPAGLFCKLPAANGARSQELPHLQEQDQAEHQQRGKTENTALLIIPSLYKILPPHLSSPAVVAEIQGRDAPHLPLARLGRYLCPGTAVIREGGSELGD